MEQRYLDGGCFRNQSKRGMDGQTYFCSLLTNVSGFFSRKTDSNKAVARWKVLLNYNWGEVLSNRHFTNIGSKRNVSYQKSFRLDRSAYIFLNLLTGGKIPKRVHQQMKFQFSCFWRFDIRMSTRRWLGICEGATCILGEERWLPRFPTHRRRWLCGGAKGCEGEWL